MRGVLLFNMPMAMARPTKRHGSSIRQFIRRIPADVLDKVRGMTLAVPVGQTGARTQTDLVRLAVRLLRDLDL